MPFDAYEVALEMVHSLRDLLPRIRAQNPSLATQIERAAPSVPLNLSEGRRRGGKDRQYHWRIAAGSTEETRAALDVAEALGYVEPEATARTRSLLDRILAMTWRMTH